MKEPVRNAVVRLEDCVIDMSKYELLWQYIQEASPSIFSFDDVERFCGICIDHSFLNAKKELEAYGYKVGKISMKDRTVRIQETIK